MKKLLSILMCVSLLSFSFYSCSDDDKQILTGTISFDKDNAVIKMGEQLTITPIFSNDDIKNKEYKWTNMSTDIVELEVNVDNSVIIKGKGIGNGSLKIENTDGTISAIYETNVTIGDIKKWVVFGNSITKHAVTSFWWGDWGMAASEREKDYVHVLNTFLEDKLDHEIVFEPILS